MSTYPDSKDRQINPEPKVSRTAKGEFLVSDVLRPHPAHGSGWVTFSAECEHCKKEISVTFNVQKKGARFVRDEAKRLALLEHLRTEHTKSSKTKKSGYAQ